MYLASEKSTKNPSPRTHVQPSCLTRQSILSPNAISPPNCNTKKDFEQEFFQSYLLFKREFNLLCHFSTKINDYLATLMTVMTPSLITLYLLRGIHFHFLVQILDIKKGKEAMTRHILCRIRKIKQA